MVSHIVDNTYMYIIHMYRDDNEILHCALGIWWCCIGRGSILSVSLLLEWKLLAQMSGRAYSPTKCLIPSPIYSHEGIQNTQSRNGLRPCYDRPEHFHMFGYLFVCLFCLLYYGCCACLQMHVCEEMEVLSLILWLSRAVQKKEKRICIVAMQENLQIQ